LVSCTVSNVPRIDNKVAVFLVQHVQIIVEICQSDAFPMLPPTHMSPNIVTDTEGTAGAVVKEYSVLQDSELVRSPHT
jgi:hypothetical protein